MKPRSVARSLFPLLLLVALLAPTALASIGEAPSTIVDALKSYQPAPAAGGFKAASDFQFQIDSASNIAIAISGNGVMNAANSTFAGDLIGAATGYGAAIAGPATQFFQQRLSDLVGKGPVSIGVEEYELHLTVTGPAPYHVEMALKPQTIDEASLPKPAHSFGPADAKHVIREFSDFQCPFCARFATTVLPQLKKGLLAKGNVRFEFYYFPLKSIHPNAITAAITAECVTAANDEAAFWTYHDLVFANQDHWASLSDPVPTLIKIAADGGLKTDGVATCVKNGTYAATIEKDYQIDTQQLHLTGTPTLFVDDLKVGDYTKVDSYTRLITLSDAMRASAGPAAGGSSGP